MTTRPYIEATLPELQFTGFGGAGALEASLPQLKFTSAGNWLISSTLPELHFSATTLIWSDITGQLPNLKFFGSFGDECFILARKLPQLAGSISTGWGTPSDRKLPSLEFSGTATREETGSFSLRLPQLQFTGTGGISFKTGLRLPQVKFSGSMITELSGVINGTLPALRAEHTVFEPWESSAKIDSAILPAMDFTGQLVRDTSSCTILANLPELLGTISAYEYETCTLSVKVPELRFTGDIIPDPYLDVTGTLPDLQLGYVFAEQISDDEIVRHSRW